MQQHSRGGSHMARQRLKFSLIGLLLIVTGFGFGWKANSSTIVNEALAALGNPPNFTQTGSHALPRIRLQEAINEALRSIRHYYVDAEKLDDRELAYGAITGMAAAVGNKYTRFMKPSEYQNFVIRSQGSLEGIGAELTQVTDRFTGAKKLTILGVMSGNPAEKAGLQPLDEITSINGLPTYDMTLGEAVDKIRGERGTNVTLGIRREWMLPPFEIKLEAVLERDYVEISPAEHKILDGNIGYVHLTDFSEKAADALDKAINEFQMNRVNGVILDLRNNPGGLLDAAVDVSSRLLPPDKLVVTVESRIQGIEKHHAKSKFYRNIQFPILVLVNEGSASASEILAGAVKDHNIGKVVGRNTYGKSSVQRVVRQRHGGALIITSAKYFTPNHHDIGDQGVSPNVRINAPKLDRSSTVTAWHKRGLENLKKAEEFTINGDELNTLYQLEDAVFCFGRSRLLEPEIEGEELTERQKEIKRLYNNAYARLLRLTRNREFDPELDEAVKILSQEIQ